MNIETITGKNINEVNIKATDFIRKNKIGMITKILDQNCITGKKLKQIIYND